MKVSLEWVRDYVDLPADLDVKDLTYELTLKTVEVEEWVDTAAAVTNVMAACVAGLESIDGGYRVVCDVGRTQPIVLASRVSDLEVGQMVAVAEPGARLVLLPGATAREVGMATVLGIESFGVLCSPRDLGVQAMFPDARDQVLRLDPAIARPGDALADVLGLNDTVLDIDNKSLTNRPDLWGHYGIARELAAIYDLPLKPLATTPWPGSREGLVGAVDAGVCRRFSTVPFDVAALPETPLWLRSRLARIGENSLNLCVDLSNYVMFAVGQPMHVYDADNIQLPLTARRVDSAMKLEVIGGATVDLEADTPVIADAHGPVALAGVIGGADSSVTAGSRRFVLETASFRARPVRRTTQQLGLRTEASARFEKDIDTQRVTEAVGYFLRLLGEIAPSAVVHSGQDASIEPTVATEVLVESEFLATRIGQDFGPVEVRTTLEALGFTVVVQEGGTLRVTSPTWRSTGDISLPHDILEEVARIHGYDKIPAARLHVTLKPVRQLNRRPLDRVLREQLAARAGMQEIVTYPWAVEHLLAATGHDKSDTIPFDGAPAPDRASLRPSLIPNLLEAVAANLRFHQAFSVFELGYVFKSCPYTARHERFEALPVQQRMLAGAIVGDTGAVLFLRAKGVLEMLRGHANLTDLRFEVSAASAWADRLAHVGVSAGGRQVGALGLLSNKVRRAAGIQTQVVCFELDVDLLSAYDSRDNRYEPVPEFPDADFDLSVVVADNVSWDEVATTVRSVHELVHAVTFVDEFRGSWVPQDHRAVTLRMTLRSATSTLTADEIAATRRAVLDSLDARHGARLREV